MPCCDHTRVLTSAASVEQGLVTNAKLAFLCVPYALEASCCHVTVAARRWMSQVASARWPVQAVQLRIVTLEFESASETSVCIGVVSIIVPALDAPNPFRKALLSRRFLAYCRRAAGVTQADP